MLPLPPPVAPLPGAAAVRVCGGAAIPYTQNGLALGFGSAWVVCTREQRVQRITGGKVVASIPLPVEPWAIAAGEGAVWALARDGTAVYRISPTTNRVTGHVELGAAGVYLWALAGAVWVADDADSTLIRVDPVGLRVSARLPAGDGPSGLAFDGVYLWLVSHRENSLDRIDPATNAVTRVATTLSPPETTRRRAGRRVRRLALDHGARARSASPFAGRSAARDRRGRACCHGRRRRTGRASGRPRSRRSPRAAETR